MVGIQRTESNKKNKNREVFCWVFVVTVVYADKFCWIDCFVVLFGLNRSNQIS